MHPKWILCAPLLTLGLLPVAYVAAQDTQEQSVAEAAKRAREQKKNAAKPARVITNDSIPPAANKPAEDSQPSQSPAETSPATEGAKEPSAAESAEPKAKEAGKKQAEVDRLKQDIAEKQSEADLAQREFALANDSYYSKPNFADDKEGKARLDGLQADLNQKKDELAQLKAKLAELGSAENTEKPGNPPQQ